MKSRSMKKDHFWQIYFLLCAFFVIVIVSVTLFLYDYIKYFEYSRPEHAAEKYVSELNSESLGGLIEKSLVGASSGFEADGVAYSVAESVLSGTLSLTEIHSGTDTLNYDVYSADDEKLMRLTLKESEESEYKYGFSSYEVCEIYIYDEWKELFENTVSVTVPESAKLYINGREVSEEYRTGDPFYGSDVSEFEMGEEFDLSLVTYTVENIFGNTVDVTAKEYRDGVGDGVGAGVGDGEDIVLFSPEEGIYTSVENAVSAVYTVTLPASAKLWINGIEVSEKYITEKIPSSDSNEFEKETAAESVVYTVRGLRYAPSVSAVMNGNELEFTETSESGTVFSYPEEYRKSYEIKIQQGETLYCNGLKVEGKYIQSVNGGNFEVPDSAVKYASGDTKYTLYKIDGFYNEPEFSLSNKENVSQTEGNVCTFYPLPSSFESETLKKTAQDFTKLFMKYSYEGTEYTKANYEAVMACVTEGSDAYSIIASSYESMRYNSNFKIDRLDMEVYGLIKYADGCYGVKVDFDSHGKYASHEKVAAGTYEMVWVTVNGEWKLAGLLFL